MFDFDRFKAGEIAVVCRTEEEALEFHELAGKAGVEWIGGNDPRKLFLYIEEYSENRGGNVYQYGYNNQVERMTYGSLDSLLDSRPNRYEIVFFSEIIALKVNPDDILSLLLGDTRMAQRKD